MATAQNVIDRARQLINDVASHFVAGLRWSDAELLQWLTDGQREIVRLKPEANTITDIFTVAGGFPRQRLNDVVAYRLIRVEANGVGGSVGGGVNLVAAWGCEVPAIGYVNTDSLPQPDYQSCRAARGSWTGDLNAMLPDAGPLTLLALQVTTSSQVFSVAIVGDNGVPPQSVFSRVSFIDANGVERTFLSSEANYEYSSNWGEAYWYWYLDSGAAMFDEGGEYEIIFTP